MAYQILVVDDEPALRMMVQEILTQAGYAVCLAGSCREALTQRAQVHPDAILLDVMLPDGDGFSLLGQLRQQGDVPVLFLSARDEDEAQELLLRLHAVLRRVYRAASEEEPARLGGTEVHWGTGTLRRDGREVPLTAKEFALLKKLWENHGNIVTIDALCQALWEGPMVGYENTLMVHIRRLREKLEADPSHPKHLLTVRGLGYRLVREAAP